jgi:hypothetical protein
MWLSACSDPDTSKRQTDAGTLRDAAVVADAEAGLADSGAERPDVVSDATSESDALSDTPGDQESDGDIERACPDSVAGVVVGTLCSSDLNEVSGLVASRLNQGVLWMHNDSGDSARLFAVSSDGTLIETFTLSGASAIDWEDIALGPGPVAEAPYLYVGDIGDNDERRPSIVVYRVREPKLLASAAPVTPLSGVEAFSFTYPDGRAHDAETLLVDPASADLFVLTKSADGSGVYRARAPLTGGTATELEFITLLRFGETPLPGSPLLTAGDIGARGDILLRTYSSAFLWRRSLGTSVADALQFGSPCRVETAIEAQGEAIAFNPDESGYFTTSEHVQQPIYFFELRWP